MTEVERDYHNNRAGRKWCLKIELQLLPFILLKKWCLLRLETCREIMRDWLPEAARRNCSMKLVFSKISQILVKHMCQVLFFIKVAGLQSGVFLWILQIFLRTPSSQNSPGRPLLHCTREAIRKSLYSMQIQENTDQNKPLYLNNFHAVNWLLMFFRIYALKKSPICPRKRICCSPFLRKQQW